MRLILGLVSNLVIIVYRLFLFEILAALLSHFLSSHIVICSEKKGSTALLKPQLV